LWARTGGFFLKHGTRGGKVSVDLPVKVIPIRDDQDVQLPGSFRSIFCEKKSIE